MSHHKKGSCLARHFQDKYILPYERLRRRNYAQKPKKVKLEKELEEECRQHRLQPFQYRTDYKLYFIHKRTDVTTIDELIDQAQSTKHYSMDTENDALTHKPATLKIECIRQDQSPIIIITEVQYLPSMNTPLSKKIQQLYLFMGISNRRIRKIYPI